MKLFLILSGVNAYSEVENSKALEKLRAKASKDCGAFIASTLSCDTVANKAEKFIHRIDKVLDDAVWHLTGAKKCRAANNIGKWAPPTSLYRKRRADDYTLDYNYDAYGSEYGAYYGGDVYGSDEYGSDEYSDYNATETTIGRAQMNETALIEEEQRMLKLNEDERDFDDQNVNDDGFEAKYVTKEKSCRLALDTFWAHEGISLCAKIGSWQRRSTGLLSQVNTHARVCDTYYPETTTTTTTTTTKPKPSKYNKKPGNKKPGKYGK